MRSPSSSSVLATCERERPVFRLCASRRAKVSASIRRDKWRVGIGWIRFPRGVAQCNTVCTSEPRSLSDAEAVDQSVSDFHLELGGVERGLGAAGEAELAQQVADVDADGFVGDAELIGDLAVGQTLGNKG